MSHLKVLMLLHYEVESYIRSEHFFFVKFKFGCISVVLKFFKCESFKVEEEILHIILHIF